MKQWDEIAEFILKTQIKGRKTGIYEQEMAKKTTQNSGRPLYILKRQRILILYV